MFTFKITKCILTSITRRGLHISFIISLAAPVVLVLVFSSILESMYLLENYIERRDFEDVSVMISTKTRGDECIEGYLHSVSMENGDVIVVIYLSSNGNTSIDKLLIRETGCSFSDIYVSMSIDMFEKLGKPCVIRLVEGNIIREYTVTHIHRDIDAILIHRPVEYAEGNKYIYICFPPRPRVLEMALEDIETNLSNVVNTWLYLLIAVSIPTIYVSLIKVIKSIKTEISSLIYLGLSRRELVSHIVLSVMIIGFFTLISLLFISILVFNTASLVSNTLFLTPLVEPRLERAVYYLVLIYIVFSTTSLIATTRIVRYESL